MDVQDKFSKSTLNYKISTYSCKSKILLNESLHIVTVISYVCVVYVCTFWLDSGTKHVISLCRSKKSWNSSSLITNFSASLRASSPAFSPSITRHWNTYWEKQQTYVLKIYVNITKWQTSNMCVLNPVLLSYLLLM